VLFRSRRLLFRAGLYADGDFAADLNGLLSGYYGSPVREASAERIRADFWNDRAVGFLPYQRGNAIAIELDYAIRRASGGTRTIDDWFRELFSRCRDSGAPVTREALFASIEHASDRATAGAIRATAVDGVLLAPREDWFAPCLEHHVAHSGTFELGFDFDATRDRKVITGLVPGSAAQRAGLRDGDALAGFSAAIGDASQPVKVTVRDGAGTRDIEYLPCVAALEVPSFQFSGSPTCGPAAGL
jgi:predicted metalloprotease with PDZ domain